MLRFLSQLAMIAASTRPDPFDHVTVYDTCSGPDAHLCKSSDCTQRCVMDGKQCFQPNRYVLGCCCDPSKLPSDNYKCRVSAKHNGTCRWECCESVRWGDRKVAATLCGDGCCSPSEHGTIYKCGRSWPAKHASSARKECCVPEGTPQEQQNRLGC